MTAYLALTQKVNDLDKYQETYIPQVRPLLEKYGIEVLGAFRRDSDRGERRQPRHPPCRV